MDESSESARTELEFLARRAGVTFTDDELARLAPRGSQSRAELEGLRAAIRPEEEPAHTFSKQVGRGRS